MLKHDFRILNNRLFSNVILGRDIMQKFKRVTFDFQSNTISFDGRQLKAVALPREKVAVRVKNVLLIPPRSEQVAIVSGTNDRAFIASDFQPHAVPGCKDIYISKAIVSPDFQGQFVITSANIGNNAVKLQPRQILGYLTKPDVIIAGISFENNVAYPIEQKYEIAKLVFGDNLTHLFYFYAFLSRDDDNPRRVN